MRDVSQKIRRLLYIVPYVAKHPGGVAVDQLAKMLGAERDELLALLEELAAWYRDLVVVASGAESAVVNADRLDQLRLDAEGAGEHSGDAAEIVRDVWRIAEELNVSASLALEALFVRLRRAFSPGVPAAR